MLDVRLQGGVVIPIRKELKLSIRYVGLGERMDDLQPFDVEVFSHALVE